MSRKTSISLGNYSEEKKNRIIDLWEAIQEGIESGIADEESTKQKLLTFTIRKSSQHDNNCIKEIID